MRNWKAAVNVSWHIKSVLKSSPVEDQVSKALITTGDSYFKI